MQHFLPSHADLTLRSLTLCKQSWIISLPCGATVRFRLLDEGGRPANQKGKRYIRDTFSKGVLYILGNESVRSIERITGPYLLPLSPEVVNDRPFVSNGNIKKSQTAFVRTLNIAVTLHWVIKVVHDVVYGGFPHGQISRDLIHLIFVTRFFLLWIKSKLNSYYYTISGFRPACYVSIFPISFY